MNKETGKAFYHNFRDLNVNVDPAAKRQRDTYDANLRSVPPPAAEKLLTTQNAIQRQEIAKLRKQLQDAKPER